MSQKPDDIPQDVWDVAEAVRGRVFNAMHDDDGRLTDNDPAEDIARAIMAERERCAKIAEKHGEARKKQYVGATAHKAHRAAHDFQSMSMAAFQVAHNIRTPDPENHNG